MTAVKAGDVEGLLRRGLAPAIGLALVYGPDAGLVAERARRLAESFLPDPGDPFALVRLDGDALAAEPGRLAEEAGTFGLFGGRRSLWVRAGSRNLAPGAEAALEVIGPDTRLVIEAGDLARSAPLRTLCERSPRAVALPCYPDEGGQLVAFVESTLREAGLGIERDAREVLVASLSGDRRATRSELEKIALYAHGRGTVTLDDIEAVGSDASGSAINAVIDAAFAGRPDEVERGYRRLRLEGTDPSVLLGAGLRHALALYAARLEGDAGKSNAALVAGWRGLHFRRQRVVETQLGRWSTAGLRRVTEVLQDTVLAARRANPALAHARASALLLRLAMGAGR